METGALFLSAFFAGMFYARSRTLNIRLKQNPGKNPPRALKRGAPGTDNTGKR
jgi:hypothetical protein